PDVPRSHPHNAITDRTVLAGADVARGSRRRVRTRPPRAAESLSGGGMTTADLDAVLADPRRKYGPPEHLHRVVPGMTRERLYREVFGGLAQNGIVKAAEIGVADGRNSLSMLLSIPGLQLLCVDPWQKYP